MGDFDLTLQVGDKVLSRDARSGRDLLSDLTFTTTWQGGPKELSGSVLRAVGDAGEEQPFAPVHLTASGGARSVWPGRLQRMPRSVSRSVAHATPQALGLGGVVLEDRQDCRALFIDRDLGRWKSASSDRRRVIAGFPSKPYEPTVRSGDLALEIQGYPWESDYGRPYAWAQYDAMPLKIRQVIASPTTVTSANDWIGQLQSGTGPDFTSPTIEVADFVTAGAGAQPTLDYTFPTRRTSVGVAFHYATAPAGTAELTWALELSNVAVVGDHDLPLTGSAPGERGVKASDAVRWLVETYCDGITPGDIVDSEFGIPHLAFLEPQSPTSILNGINNYHGWAWGVWEDGRFDFHPYGQGRSQTWYVAAGDAGVLLDQDGDDAGQLFTDIVVSFQDRGRTTTVGSPRTLCDTTSDLLTVTDPAHPAIAAGVRRVAHYALDGPSTLQAATVVGATMLDQYNAASRAGSATVQGYVRDASGVTVPVYMVRGGDQVVFTDIGDETPRRVVGTAYTHASRSVVMTLDNQLQSVEALVAHLGAQTTGRI